MSCTENHNLGAKDRQRLRLDELKINQRAIIVRIGGKGPVRQRMMDMGLLPGSELVVARLAPLGDPIEFFIKGYSLSLRRSEAREIEVEVARE